ncbi:MAG: metallophosphoesterase family protein [Treponema sp.]|nr:metallophosphoesterase family protein [Treponema sp.]
MIKSKFLTLLLGICFLFCVLPQGHANDGFEAQTLTLTPGRTTAEINITWYGDADDGRSGKVKYALNSAVRNGAFPANAQVLDAAGIDASTGKVSHKATITGLTPNTLYAYSVSSDGINFSRIYTYRTPAAGRFTFVAVGDPQLTEPGVSPTAEGVPGGFMEKNNSRTTRQSWIDVVNVISRQVTNVRFIAGVGDAIDRNLISELGRPEDSSNPHEVKYANFFAPPALRSLPFAPVVGNHESRSNFGFLYHYNIPNEQPLTSVPTGQSGSRHEMESRGNYFYLYNNALFVVLNTSAYPRNRDEAARIINEHFDVTLTAAVQQHQGQYRWLFVQTHKSIASLADHAADRDIQFYVEAGFQQLMDKHNVDFVLAGHDHIYARSYPMRDGRRISNTGGTVYFTLNSSTGQKFYEEFVPDVKNNTEYPYFEDGTAGSAVLMSGNIPYPVNFYHQDYKPMFLEIDVNNNTVTFRAHEVQDNLRTRVVDTFTVSK